MNESPYERNYRSHQRALNQERLETRTDILHNTEIRKTHEQNLDDALGAVRQDPNSDVKLKKLKDLTLFCTGDWGNSRGGKELSLKAKQIMEEFGF